MATVNEPQWIKYKHFYSTSDGVKHTWKIVGKLVPYKNGTQGFNLYLDNVPMTFDPVAKVHVPVQLCSFDMDDKDEGNGKNAPAETHSPFEGDSSE